MCFTKTAKPDRGFLIQKRDLISFACGVGLSLATGLLAQALFGTTKRAQARVTSRGPQVKRTTDKGEPRAPRRVGGVCKLRPEMFDQYTQLHDRTWDEVMERMYAANMRNFLVYYHKESNLMFSHFEYIGDEAEFASDMAKLDSDPLIRFWWSHCEPCQEPLKWEGKPPSQGGDGGPNGEWWASLQLLNSCGAWPISWSESWPDPDFQPCNLYGKTCSFTSPPPVHNRPKSFSSQLDDSGSSTITCSEKPYKQGDEGLVLENYIIEPKSKSAVDNSSLSGAAVPSQDAVQVFQGSSDQMEEGVCIRQADGEHSSDNASITSVGSISDLANPTGVETAPQTVGGIGNLIYNVATRSLWGT